MGVDGKITYAAEVGSVPVEAGSSLTLHKHDINGIELIDDDMAMAFVDGSDEKSHIVKNANDSPIDFDKDLDH